MSDCEKGKKEENEACTKHEVKETRCDVAPRSGVGSDMDWDWESGKRMSSRRLTTLHMLLKNDI